MTISHERQLMGIARTISIHFWKMEAISQTIRKCFFHPVVEKLKYKAQRRTCVTKAEEAHLIWFPVRSSVSKTTTGMSRSYLSSSSVGSFRGIITHFSTIVVESSSVIVKKEDQCAGKRAPASSTLHRGRSCDLAAMDESCDFPTQRIWIITWLVMNVVAIIG